MDVQCGMCGEPVTLRYEASESEEIPSSVLCLACQDYTMGYIYPEPVLAPSKVSESQACTDYERWLKQRSTNKRRK